MKSWWTKLWKTTVDHNPFGTIGIVLVLVLIAFTVWAAGCKSTTLFQGEKVTRAELEQKVILAAGKISKDITEHQALLEQDKANAESLGEQEVAATVDLDQQDEAKAAIFQVLMTQATTAATTGTVNPAAIVGGLGLIASIVLGLGAGLDNLNKNKKIDRDKKAIANLNAKVAALATSPVATSGAG